MPSLIEDALAAATRLRRRANESRTDFAARLVSGCDSMKDDEWNALTKEQQEWANSAIRALSDGAEIPAYPDEVPDPEPAPPEPEPATTDTATEEAMPTDTAPAAPARARLTPPSAPVHRGTVVPRRARAAVKAAPKAKVAKAKVAPKAAVKAAPKAKVAKAKAPRADDKSGVAILRKIVVKSPNATVEALRERIHKDFPGMSDNTIQSVRAATRSTMKLLPEYAEKII